MTGINHHTTGAKFVFVNRLRNSLIPEPTGATKLADAHFKMRPGETKRKAQKFMLLTPLLGEGLHGGRLRVDHYNTRL